MENTSLNQTTEPGSNFERFNDNHAPRCRICISNERKEELISPCRCKGSLKMVHQDCLGHWLESQGTDACEICNTVFTTVRTPKSLRQWFLDPDNKYERRHLLEDLSIMILVTPVVATCVITSILTIIPYFKHAIYLVFATSISFLTVILILVYVYYVVLTLRYHYKMFKQWRKFNFNIQVVDHSLTSENLPEIENDQAMCNQSSSHEINSLNMEKRTPVLSDRNNDVTSKSSPATSINKIQKPTSQEENIQIGPLDRETSNTSKNRQNQSSLEKVQMSMLQQETVQLSLSEQGRSKASKDRQIQPDLET